MANVISYKGLRRNKKCHKLKMAAVAIEFTEERLNYYRICCVATDIITEGLRSIFKQEWDNRFKTTLGEWKDEPMNGIDFKNGESPGNQRRNAKLLATMINGDRAEWDCTMLFYAILYSDSIGRGLNSVIKSNIDDLRKFRNEEFAHMPKGHLSDPDFQIAIGKVHAAFQGLGLSILQIQDIRNQTSFPTEELGKVLKKVDDLRQELQEKEKKLQEKGKELQEKEEERQVLHDQLQKEISSFCILSPKPSHDVASRDFEVAEIMQQLKHLKSTNENKLSFLYISGNPGSGKSQLAGLVAERFFKRGTEIPCATLFVMTLNAENQDTLLESYVSFARRLKCPEFAVTNTIGSKDLTTEEKISNLKTLIGTKIELYTSWLLVVDNVTNISRVHAHLPESGNEQWENGQLLITTQNTASIPLPSSFIKHISVSKGMKPHDASCLLAKLSCMDDGELGKEVAEALDFQPLALASAATYVRQVQQNKATSHFGWTDYLEKLNKGQRGTTEAFLAETNPSYPKSMSKATTLAVEKAMTSDKIIHHTFSLLSVCAPQPLSQDIVINYILNVDEEIQDKEMIAMRIQRCSLILIEENESGACIRVHQVVYDAINSLIRDFPETHQIQIVDAAIRSFIQFLESNPSVSRNSSDSIIYSKPVVPHLQTLCIKTENLFQKQDTSQDTQRSIINVQNYPSSFQKLGIVCKRHCVFDVAMKYLSLALEFFQYSGEYNQGDETRCYTYLESVHHDLGDLEQAKEYHELALTTHQKKLGPDHNDFDVTTCYNIMASVHHDLGNLGQAKEYMELALAIRLKKLGHDHVDVATCYNNLGAVHRDLGDLEQTKEYHERALAILLKKLGHDHVDVATCYNNLGAIHRNLGDLEQAKEYRERALPIYLKKRGHDHVDVATCYNNLGVVHHDLGDLEQAKEYHERALAIYLKKLGHDHVDVAKCYNNLGGVHHHLGDLEQAKEDYERALAIYLKRLGDDHVDVATCYNNLGAVHRDLGNLEQAKEYQERALAILLKKLGDDHVDVATCYNNLGAVHRDLANLEQAKEYHERALAIRLKKLGHDHVDVAACYNNLGVAHHDLGDLEQTKEYHERALAIRLKKLGHDHVDVATCYNNLGAVHRDLGDLEQTKEYHERALAIRLKKLGHDHVDVATCYNNLGAVHRDLGDLEQAKEYHERALAIRLKKLGHDHVDVATCYNNLGAVHRDLGDLEQAKEYRERALAIYLKKLGHDHVTVATCYNNLGGVHHDLADLEQAKEYHERALAIRLKKLGDDHVDVATCYNNLGAVHRALGDLEQAKEYHERALAIRLKKLGDDHVDVATCYNNLGAVHRALGDLEQGKEYYELALAIYLKKLGPEHGYVLAVQNALTQLQQDDGRYLPKKACSSYS